METKDYTTTKQLRDRLHRLMGEPQHQSTLPSLTLLAEVMLERLEILEQQNEAIRNEAPSPSEIRSLEMRIQNLEVAALKVEAERNALFEVIKLALGKAE